MSQETKQLREYGCVHGDVTQNDGRSIRDWSTLTSAHPEGSRYVSEKNADNFFWRGEI
jgi:hypothetical protein